MNQWLAQPISRADTILLVIGAVSAIGFIVGAALVISALKGK